MKVRRYTYLHTCNKYNIYYFFKFKVAKILSTLATLYYRYISKYVLTYVWVLICTHHHNLLTFSSAILLYSSNDGHIVYGSAKVPGPVSKFKQFLFKFVGCFRTYFCEMLVVVL